MSELGPKREGRKRAGEKLRRAVSTVEHPGGGEEALSNWEGTLGEKSGLAASTGSCPNLGNGKSGHGVLRPERLPSATGGLWPWAQGSREQEAFERWC